MAIRFRRYLRKGSNGETIQAVRLNEKNVEELVAYVNKNGGEITNETVVYKHDALKDGKYTAVKVAIKQRVWSGGRVRKAIRKAFYGDFIVRNKLEDGSYEFWRVKDAGVDGYSPA